MTDDDRFRAAVLMMTSAIHVFRQQGYEPQLVVRRIEEEVFTPGGELYNENRGRDATH